MVSDVGGICASCSIPAHFDTDSCAIELKNDQHSYLFNISRRNNPNWNVSQYQKKESTVFMHMRWSLECTHDCTELSNITIRESESESVTLVLLVLE